ncbi:MULTISPECIES: alginate O-acetyltransferase [Pseudomonas]|uniref:alginate O-acetyltransferase n=1 Tax=Pseudomonas TaxID=286 RepID=UPI0015DCEC40|nr:MULTISPECIES: alginate O-acetyltransferase [Pseudomonas]MBH3357720.1 alginate O-acetyltransferase [Pseudomonas guariconensis]MDM9595774.1 alginate O-acetyltransferase [Pseudomonas guariconensis]MDM9608604.1 alginate O-acetyltransferase [Pseudomonas guariconensis]MDM9613561.1 alginate O-acetyltransferase [Pseudomonas guariconensis]MEB3840932.1 alginate O-acetyltransferase [Pseudomonas guariconensis]
MTPHLMKLLGLSAALLAISQGVRAADVQAPSFTAEPCCQLCPEAHDASRYVTRYQQNFTTLVQAKGDWLFRTREDLRTEFNTTPAGYKRLQQVHDAFKKRGVELVLVYQPTRGLVNRNMLNPAEKAAFDYQKALGNYQAMLKRFASMGYNVPDLSPLTNEQLAAADQGKDFYFRGDQHWTPYGAERAAKIVADTVHKMPAFEGIPRKEFETHKSGRMGKTGTLHNVAGQLCGTSYAVQYMDQFATEPKGGASDGDDLFGDSGNAKITLVGTSHSGKNYNFSGFLQQYIGADVLNVAFPGGGLEGSMIQYLGSEEFKKNPPKILIWEFSPLYRLDQETIWRQILALLDDGCDDRPAQMSASATLKPGKNELMVNGKGGVIKDLINRNHQLDIKFEDTSVKVLQATLWYLNGRHEDIKIEKPETSDTDGRFVFQMREDEDWASQNLLALEIQGPETGTQKVEAKLCKRNNFAGHAQNTAQAGQ